MTVIDHLTYLSFKRAIRKPQHIPTHSGHMSRASDDIGRASTPHEQEVQPFEA
jgi:hypothetical protein